MLKSLKNLFLRSNLLTDMEPIIALESINTLKYINLEKNKFKWFSDSLTELEKRGVKIFK